MHRLDLTLPSPQQNLACDEALLVWCEEDNGPEVLRFWEPREPFVVLGYSNKAATEANLNSCRAHGIPVLRRCTGGGTVLQGPGCLNYSLVLRIGETGPLSTLTGTNCYIMQRHRDALQPLVGRKIEVEGYTDLAIGGLKFSGNSQRRARRHLLFHGTFLLRFGLAAVEEYLPMPSRQPPYRQNRSHAGFLMNLSLPPEVVRDALQQAWQATKKLSGLPTERIRQLAAEKYATDDWNLKF